METRCPHCHTVFRIGMEQLSMANGQVRCGQCNHIFNAANHIVTAKHETAEQGRLLDSIRIDIPEVHREDFQVEVPELDIPGHENTNTHTAFVATEQHETAVAAEPASDDTPHDDPQAPQRGDRTETSTGNKRHYDVTSLYPELQNAPALQTPPTAVATFSWSLLIIALVVLMFMQLSYFMRDHLGRKPALRPLLESMCDYMQCELARPRAPALIQLESHKVLSHPQASDALRVEAVITNNAGYTQAYPVLRLRFRDLDGRLLASRNFLPNNYLPTDIDQAAGMAPGEPVNAVLDIIDPGKHAISYEFDFL